MKALRQTIDLSAYPDLVVSVADRPDGLLLHENIFYSLIPLHLGMRQYRRDFEPHREWWKRFLRDTGGTGFWHELYFCTGWF
jgi:hypothetical protein